MTNNAQDDTSSRFQRAMDHMKSSLEWARQYDEWISHHANSHSLRQINSMHTSEEALQLALLEYQKTLIQPLPIKQRLDYLINILLTVSGAHVSIINYVSRHIENSKTWVKSDNAELTELYDSTDELRLKEVLGGGQHQLISLTLNESGHVIIHLSFEDGRNRLTSSLLSDIEQYWLPLLYSALTDFLLRDTVDKHQVLYQVARIANTSDDQEELFEEYVHFVTPLLGATEVAVMLPAPLGEKEALYWKWLNYGHHKTSSSPDKELSRYRMKDAEPVPDAVGEFLRKRVYFNPGIRQFTEDSAFHLILQQYMENSPANEGCGLNKRFYTVAPFELNGRSIDAQHAPQPYGLIFVHNQPWNNAQLDIITEANQWVWQAFQRTRHFDKMLYLAQYDELTGLLNRRAMQERFIMEAERAVRNQRPLSIAVLDIDYFKQFNDQYGHLVGDNVLQRLSHFLNSQIRRADVLCRYGGEEFVLLLPETDGDEAHELVDRLRSTVASSLKIPVDKDNDVWKPVTFSGGVREVDLSSVNGSLLFALGADDWRIIFEEALNLADESLYAAKKEGRNKVY